MRAPCYDPAMRIHFERHGGYAGLRLSYDADVDSLPAATASELRELIRSAGLLEMGRTFPPPQASRVRDGMSYRLQIEVGESTRTVELSDVGAPAEVQPLLAFLSKLALSSRK